MLSTLASPVASTPHAPADAATHAPPPAAAVADATAVLGNRLVALLRTLAPAGALTGLERVELPAGRLLLQRGRAVSHVWFPVDALVSALGTMRNGASLEVAVVGAEGLVGGEACLAGLPATHDVAVQVGGSAWRLPSAVLAPLCQRVPALHEAVLQVTFSLLVQASQTAACNRHHCMEQQVSRWLLLAAQRLRRRELPMTQERLSALLGVRREGVTECARRLQAAGYIRYARGRIHLLDPDGLAQRACECHGVLGAGLERLHRSLDRIAGRN